MRRPSSAASTSGGDRRAPQRIQDLRVHDRPARDAVGELAADGLDFGQLGHAISVRTVPGAEVSSGGRGDAP